MILIRQRKHIRWILHFILYEICLKTLYICLISTLIVAALLNLAPKSDKEVRITSSSYIAWIGNVISGNLGRGKAGQRISEEMTEKFKVTLGLAFFALIPALTISFILGLSQNVRWVGISGNVILFFTTLPAFFMGYVFMGMFGFQSSGDGNFLLAVITLGLSSGVINEISRVIMHSMNNELSKDYIETAKVKGLRESAFPWKGNIGFHAFKNALITIVPRIGALLAFIISGSIVVEQVFSLPGLSFMLLDGLNAHDNSRVLTVILLSVILVRLGTILSNFLYLLCNPKYGEM